MRKVGIAWACLLACAGLAAAQTAPNLPGFVSVAVYHASKPLEFERIVTRVLEAANKINADNRWVATQRMMGEGGVYIIYAEREKWADLDRVTPGMELLTKAFGATEAQQIMRQASETIRSSEAFFLRLRAELSYNLERDIPANAKILRTTAYWVRPGRAPDYEALVKRFIEASTKTDSPAHFTTGQTVSGGGPNYWITTFAPNFAEFDNDPGNVIKKAFGDDEYERFRMKAADVVERSENYTHMMRPNLSRPPQAYLDANKDFWAPKAQPAAAGKMPAAKKAPAEKKPAAEKKP